MGRIQSFITQRVILGIVLLSQICSCAVWLLPALDILSVSTAGDIRVGFSVPPTEASIRKAFSLTEDGTSLQGEFFFNGNDVIFKPLNGLREGREYVILISAIAEDAMGNSLAADFQHRFHTKETLEGPRIVSVEPKNETSLALPPEAITLVFSKPVDTNSFTEALRLSPSVTYVLEWKEDYSAVKIIPVKPLTEGTRYTITVSTALMDLSRNRLPLPFNSTFLYGADRSPPRCDLSWESPLGITGSFVPGVLNGHIPSDSNITISFNKKVAIESLAGFISISPALSYTVTPNLEYRNQGTISFPQRPEWGKPYTLTIRKGITDTLGNKTEEDIEFPLVFNHGKFRPPVFAWGGLKNKDTMARISGDTDFSTINFDPAHFPVNIVKPIDIYLVFRITADAGSVLLTSAMQAISISTANGCAEISIRTMEILSEAEYAASDIYDSAAAPETGEKFCVIKIGIEFKNANQLGFIIFSINRELSDSLGNTMTGNITLTYNKQ